MKNRLNIPLFLVAVVFLLLLSAGSAQAGHSLFRFSLQTTPRPTLPKPTKVPTEIKHGGGYKQPTPIQIPTKILPTPTPSITPTPTQTLDLSLNTFLSGNLAIDTPTNTATPFIDHAPTQSAITAALQVTYSASQRTITPVPSTSNTVTKGVIIPFVFVVIILTGIFSIRELLRKRF